VSDEGIVGLIFAFQLPLSGSRAASSSMCPSGTISLSTPSLGITGQSAIFSEPRQMLSFNSLSRDHVVDTISKVEINLVPAFNSLSRDHTAWCLP